MTFPRVDHTADWAPSFTPESVDARRDRSQDFQRRWSALDVTKAPVSVQVDHRLLGSALARVTWELDITRNWERDAVMQVQQSIGPYFDLLLRPPPFSEERQQGIVHQLASVPAQLEASGANTSSGSSIT